MFSLLAQSGSGGYLDPDMVLLHEERVACTAAHAMLGLAPMLTDQELRTQPAAQAAPQAAPQTPQADTETPARDETQGSLLNMSQFSQGMTQDTPATPATAERRRPRAVIGGDVARGTPLEAPLWAASALHGCGALTLQVPASWGAEALLAFKMDASVPSLAARGPYAMELGALVSTYLPAQDAARVSSTIVDLYLRRYYGVYRAARAKGHDVAAARDKLSLREQRVLQAILDDDGAREAWRRRGALNSL